MEVRDCSISEHAAVCSAKDGACLRVSSRSSNGDRLACSLSGLDGMRVAELSFGLPWSMSYTYPHIQKTVIQVLKNAGYICFDRFSDFLLTVHVKGSWKARIVIDVPKSVPVLCTALDRHTASITAI